MGSGIATTRGDCMRLDGDTAGSGMPLSKNIEVQIEPVA